MGSTRGEGRRERRGGVRHDWIDLQPPLWAPFLWWATLVGYVIASAVTEPPAGCTPAQPCQPDNALPIMLALLAVAALTVWWQPRLALTAGVGAGLVAAFFDPSPQGRWAAVIVVLVAAAGLAWLWSVRTRQSMVAAAASAPPAFPWPASPSTSPHPSSTTAPAQVSPRSTPWPRLDLMTWLRVAVGVCGLVLLAACLLTYRHQIDAERNHVARAVTVTGTVLTSATDDDFKQPFALDDPAAGRTRVLIEPMQPLPQGSSWPILLDPGDPSWARLVSEPAGYTHWFGWAFLGGIAAAWAAARVLAVTRAHRLTTEPRMYAARLSEDAVDLRLDGVSQPVASVPLGRHQTASSRDVRVLIRGPVRDDGFVAIATEDEVLPVDGPIRADNRWRELVLPSPWGRSLNWSAVGRALRAALILIAGVVIAAVGIMQAGPAWKAAHGQGVPGTATVMSEDCSGKGGCTHFVDFRSDDGRYVFPNVELIGASGAVGSTDKAFYVGRGETPEFVYGTGWSSFREAVFMLAFGLGGVGMALFDAFPRGRRRRTTGGGRHGEP